MPTQTLRILVNNFKIAFMQKIILFYKFTPVKDTDAVRRWQTFMAAERGLNGRVIVSEHGINATFGGDIEALEDYIEQMNITALADFSEIDYKWSNGGHNDFPKLSVKVRKELVTLDPDESFDVFDTSTALSPTKWHEYLEKHPDVTVLDARNNYESKIGVFNTQNLYAPDINSFKEIKKELDKLPKDKPVLTYCTGDVRCEYLSAYMKHKGFDEVYHLDGGIVRYGEQFTDKGYWDGKCYVFDDRTSIAFSDESKDIAECDYCHKATSTYMNCRNAKCNKRVLRCESCVEMEYCRQCSKKISVVN
jgi:UPF0176 protein